MAVVTFVYCYPTVLETEAGRVVVDEALTSLATELKIGDEAQLRPSGANSIIRGIGPRDVWRAVDRAVPDWEDRHLFFAPSFF